MRGASNSPFPIPASPSNRWSSIVRRLFNAYETRIAGEFVCSDKDCDRAGMRLRLRVIRQGVDLIDMPPIGDRTERDYFADAGGRVLALLDPFVALAALSETQPLKATTLARRLIRAHHKDAKWAHNLVGIIRQNQGDQAGAIEEFRAAIALDPGFLQARTNLGGSAGPGRRSCRRPGRVRRDAAPRSRQRLGAGRQCRARVGQGRRRRGGEVACRSVRCRPRRPALLRQGRQDPAATQAAATTPSPC